MTSTLVRLLPMLLASLASASHHYGGSSTYTYKGRNPDGTFKVDFRNRATFDSWQSSHYWYCYNGNCGNNPSNQVGVLDRSTNAPQYNREWCETETVSTRNIPTDRPFQMRADSCCWITTRNGLFNWRLLTSVDLGSRSDTGQPNHSPDIAILPFLRVPQNCPRTYKLMSFDPDGDRVRCRYGSVSDGECSTCNQPSGFILDEGSCSLHYLNSNANPSPYGFELVVEDFPQRHITLAYTDGGRDSRAPLTVRRKRQVPSAAAYTSVSPWGSWGQTTAEPTTAAPTTSPWWGWWFTTTPATTTAEPTTAAPTTSPWWGWWYTTTPATTTAEPTTTDPPTTPWGWWYTTTPPTTTAEPTTTDPPTTPWGWWYTTTPATTTAEPTTTDPPTTPWGWWYTTTPPTNPWWYTTTPWWYSTTAPPATTTAYTTYAGTMRNLHATTPPLSKLPLQFSLLVDPPAPSCQEGHYLPQFVHPTPENGARVQAEINKEVEIRVKAQAAYATIHDIIISGPLNISKHRTAYDEFAIKWSPNPDDLGDHYPICFAVESVTGHAGNALPGTTLSYHYHPSPSSQSGVYQSEMRCVLVDIRKEQVKSHVICGESTMTVEVEKSSFRGLSEEHLRLSDPSNTACSLQSYSNSTHIIAVVPLNACGTQIEEDEENLIFKNEITTVDSTEYLITRKHQLEVQFYCQYPKRGNVTLGFTAHRRNVTVWEKGFGTFTYQFEFYPNAQFQTQIDPNDYPLEYDIGRRIYMQIEATTAVDDTELFVESCSAAPYDNPNYWPTYPIIDNGCNVDPTVELHSPAHQRQFQFSMEAFKFIGLHDQVYISCSVLICESGSPGTRCSQGCLNSTSAGHQHHRRRREAATQTVRHFISQGPLRLRRAAESSGSPVINLNLNLVFIAGCLLAAVGMISAVVIYKAKISRVKYQPLPAFES
ncbi:uncharacterized protein LOC144521155 isoform X2 [Sander vitreus]